MAMRLPEIGVILRRLEPGERAYDPDGDDIIGNRTKLGGEPDWIQYDETPACPGCYRDTMTFIAQIDSVDYSGDYPSKKNEDEQYMFGDVGMIYVFYCFECGEVHSILQCY
jgi:hypothetical protein